MLLAVEKMTAWEFDTSETGLRTIFKEYEEQAMHLLWRKTEGLNSRSVWEGVNGKLKEPISRASIINFLERMADQGILHKTETTGKGGHRGIYSPAMDEAEFRKHTAEEICKSVNKNLKP